MIRNLVKKGRRSKSRTEFGVMHADTSMEGVLMKYVNVVKGWQRRYFVLQFGVLSYYVEVEEKRRERGSSREETQQPPSLQGALAQTAHDGGAALERVRTSSHGTPSPTGKAPLGGDRPALASSAVINDSHQPALSKSASLTPAQGRRNKYRGSINMQFAVVSKDDSDPCRFALDCGTVIYHLKAPSEADRDAWVAALVESKRYHEEIVSRAEMRTLTLKDFQNKAALVDLLNGQGAPEAGANGDDSGYREALKAHNALLAELKRIQQVASSAAFAASHSPKEYQVECMRVMEQAFAPDSGSSDPRAVVAGLCDLTAMSINVLESESQLWMMKLKVEQLAHAERKASLAQSGMLTLRRTSQAKEVGSDDSSDMEFFDVITNNALFDQRSFEDRRSDDLSKGAEAARVVAMRRIDTLDLGFGTGDALMRKSIPKPAKEMARVSVWSFLKNCIGKDLSKIAMPVVFNEPLSFLQRMTEDVEYSELLDRAAVCDDERERILLVAAMALSHYSSTMERLGKPFNPLLGETYELVSAARGMRVIAEQVSHHPPISSIHIEGHENSWTYRSNIEVRNVFFGKSLEVRPTGWNHVYLKKYDAHYTYFQPTTCVHNIVVGSLWVDNYGDVIVKEHRTGLQLHVTLYKSGWMSDKKLYASVAGEVVDRNGLRMGAKIGGRWDSLLRCEIDGQTKTLWTVVPRPPRDQSANFNMTSWAIGLNTPVPEQCIQEVAPTDSRFRPDQRLLEEARVEEATEEKLRLEAKQRKRRKEYEEQGKTHTARWFKKEFDPDIGEEDWKFTGEYWQCKQARAWPNCLDIFSYDAAEPTSSLPRESTR